VAEAKIFACKANAQHGLNMTRSERQRALMDFIKFSLLEDPLLSNVAVARNFGGTSIKTVRRYRTKLEESGEIEVTTQRRGADGRVIEAVDIGNPTWANAQVNQADNLPASSDEETGDQQITNVTSESPESEQEGQPKQDLVVKFAGKRIKTLDDLMKVKTPDQKLLDQFFELDLAVIKVRKLVTELSAHPRPKIRSILYGRDEITRTLSYQATSLGESAQFYRELAFCDGGKSESEAQIIEPTEADQDGQQTIAGLLEGKHVQDGKD